MFVTIKYFKKIIFSPSLLLLMVGKKFQYQIYNLKNGFSFKFFIHLLTLFVNFSSFFQYPFLWEFQSHSLRASIPGFQSLSNNTSTLASCFFLATFVIETVE